MYDHPKKTSKPIVSRFNYLPIMHHVKTKLQFTRLDAKIEKKFPSQPIVFFPVQKLLYIETNYCSILLYNIKFTAIEFLEHTFFK